MNDDLRVRLFLLGGMLVASIAGYVLLASYQSKVREQTRTEREATRAREVVRPGGRPHGGSDVRPRTDPRLARIQQLRRRQPDEALALCRALIAEAGPAADTARTRLGALAVAAASHAVRRREFARVEGLLAALDEGTPSTAERKQLAEIWNRARAELAEQAIAAGDDAAAATWIAKAVAQRGRMPRRYLVWAGRRWQATRDPALLDQVVAAWLAGGLSHLGTFHQAMARGSTPAALREAAAAETDPGRAMLLLEAGLQVARDGETRTTLRRELDERVLALAGQAAEGTRLAATSAIQPALLNVHRRTTERLRREKDAAARPPLIARLADCWRLTFRVAVHEATRLVDAGEWNDADRIVRRCLGHDSTFYFRARAMDPAFDPWPDIPEAIQRRLKGTTRRKRLAEVATLMGGRRYEHPFAETAPLRALLPAIRAGQGIDRLARQREDALSMLRRVLRDYPDHEAATTVRTAVRNRLVVAVRDRDLGALVDYAAFVVAEDRPTPADPHHALLLNAMKRALAELARAPRQAMTHLFVESLLAEVFPDDPAGQAARASAFERAYALARSGGRDPSGEPVASGLDGLSYQAIDNGTPYHLLLFYRGPESFTARIDPLRRGTVVFRDGSYDCAVFVTRDGIRPFRGTVAFAGQARAITYRISRGGTTNVRSVRTSHGVFRLLRSPLDGLVVDPKTGAVRRP